MKKLRMLTLVAIALLSNNAANANAWCKRPQIDNHIGNCYVNDVAVIHNKTTGKYGFANKQNQIIIPTQYDAANDFSQGLGVEVIPFICDKIDGFMVGKNHNKIVAHLNGEMFYFTKNGRPLN